MHWNGSYVFGLKIVQKSRTSLRKMCIRQWSIHWTAKDKVYLLKVKSISISYNIIRVYFHDFQIKQLLVPTFTPFQLINAVEDHPQPLYSITTQPQL